MQPNHRLAATLGALGALAVVVLLGAAFVSRGGVAAQTLPEGFSIEFVYNDGSGPGTATLAASGAAPDGGSAIAVTISQNGAVYRGQGSARQQDAQAYTLAFSVADANANTYSFRGMLQLGVDSWTAEGTWQADYAPGISDRWTMTSRTPAPPPPSPTPVAGGADITLANDGQTIPLAVGESFLLRLGDEYTWRVRVEDMGVVGRVIGVSVMRGAQGLFRANASGQTTISASGDPLCREQQPACAAPSRLFRVTIVVQ